ncbi:hypothetical protein C8R44DRAFT_727012 [Mycena epipterygia]|nr:hypothetical protein C8R44DRAFT_727012 [Mycena epipterygia]
MPSTSSNSSYYGEHTRQQVGGNVGLFAAGIVVLVDNMLLGLFRNILLVGMAHGARRCHRRAREKRSREGVEQEWSDDAAPSRCKQVSSINFLRNPPKVYKTAVQSFSICETGTDCFCQPNTNKDAGSIMADAGPQLKCETSD